MQFEKSQKVISASKLPFAVEARNQVFGILEEAVEIKILFLMATFELALQWEKQ